MGLFVIRIDLQSFAKAFFRFLIRFRRPSTEPSNTQVIGHCLIARDCLLVLARMRRKLSYFATKELSVHIPAVSEADRRRYEGGIKSAVTRKMPTIVVHLTRETTFTSGTNCRQGNWFRSSALVMLQCRFLEWPAFIRVVMSEKRQSRDSIRLLAVPNCHFSS